MIVNGTKGATRHGEVVSGGGDSPDQSSLVNSEVSIFACRIQREQTPSSDQGHASRHAKHRHENMTRRGEVERDDGQEVRKRGLGGWITRS